MTDWRSTGFPASDAKDDFSRARRKEQWAKVAARVRGRPGDLNVLLPYDEVVAALGLRGRRRVGERSVPISQIVGSVDRTRDFDRSFRPTSDVARARFERLATAARRGEQLPSVDLYRVGRGHDALYFVLDGHHRIAVASALKREAVTAVVTEIVTQLPMRSDLRTSDLVTKSHERLFHERVPLPLEGRDAVQLRDPADYARLAEGVEAWGFRVMQQTGEHLDRPTAAQRWWTDEYQPVVAMLREAGLIGGLASLRPVRETPPQALADEAAADLPPDGLTETEAYLRLAEQHYLLQRSHRWDGRALQRLQEARPAGRRRGRRAAGPRRA